MNRELTLLRADPRHAAVLTEIAVAAKRHWGYPERWIQLWMPQLTITPDYLSRNETWVAMLDEQTVAFSSLKQENESLWLDNLWVLPGFMGQGIGGFLFRHALIRGRARGASVLRIESEPHAQGFYEKMGARKIGEHHTEVDGQEQVLPVLEVNI